MYVIDVFNFICSKRQNISLQMSVFSVFLSAT